MSSLRFSFCTWQGVNLGDKVAARYKSKKVTDTGTVVYQYSERQVAKRNKDKAERLEKLRSSISDLRSQYRKDLTAKDPQTRLTALAVALMDETYERVGNDASAEDGHFGVTGWGKKHISFSGDSATISYVGKSGVKQKKSVATPAIVKALRQAYDECDGCIFDGEVKVKSDTVNSYLKAYGVTAKDIRGFHANDVMKANLKTVRTGKLPSDAKERKKALKEEFLEALEATAEAVGHEASTLRNQYLVPGLEDSYLRDGTILTKMVKEASTCCMACTAPPVRVAELDSGLRWFCATHWTPWEKANRDAIRIALDLDGGRAPSALAFRVIERYVRR